MRQVISLWLPTWPTDRLRRAGPASAPPPDTPLALTARSGSRRLVVAADHAAQALGVRPGMAATLARALLPTLALHPAEPARDADALHRLALWLVARYTPIVALDPPQGILLDVTGAAHRHGGLSALIDDLAARLRTAGVHARIACAPTPGAAHALARFGPDPCHMLEQEVMPELGSLPVAALRLDDRLVARLGKVGIASIADLAAQPRAALALRYGPMPGQRLDQALGRLAEPLALVEPPLPCMVEQRFAEPIAAPETLARYTAKLVDQLCAALERRGAGARRLDLLFHRVDHDVQALGVGLAQPTRAPARLLRLLRDRLDTIDPGFGIERMRLIASRHERLGARPVSDLATPPAPDLAELVDILAARVGAAHLYRVAAAESDLPERSVIRVPALAPPTTLRWPPAWPRPVRLFAHPVPVETITLLPDHPPVQFRWGTKRRRVLRADGPERIHGEWFRTDWSRGERLRGETAPLAVRDYFLVEDEEGARYWLFRTGDGSDPLTGDGRWYLHGLFG